MSLLLLKQNLFRRLQRIQNPRKMLARLISQGIRRVVRNWQCFISTALPWQTPCTSGDQLHQLPVGMLILWVHPLCILHLCPNRNLQLLHPRAILLEKVHYLLAFLYYLINVSSSIIFYLNMIALPHLL